MGRLAVVAYDIASDRQRRAALRVLRRWRLDGQKSVHECRLDEGEATELYLQLGETLQPETDRLLLVWCRAGGPARRMGRAAKAGAGPLRLFR